MKKFLLLMLLTLLLAGCVGEWVKVDDSKILHKTELYRVTLPVDWVSMQVGDTLIVTRDGPNIQKINLRASKHENAFDDIKAKSKADMLPTELAELYIAELKKEDSNGLPSLTIISNEPARVSGHDAFSLHASYQIFNGLEYQLLAVGFVTEKYVYILSYTAPTLVFFEQNRASYDQVLGSLEAI